MRTPFLGGTYTSRSRNLAYSRAVNIYCEIVEGKQGKEIGAFYGTPGLDLLVSAGVGPIRGGIVAGANAYVVSGLEVYKVDQAYIATLLGTIGTSSGPVDMISSGTQLLISDGSVGYLVTLATGALTKVASFPAGASKLTYQDGFGLASVAATNQFNQSNSNDLGTWGALNFSNADAQPGNIISLADLNREVWVLCDNNVEVWINAALAGFAFQRLSGIYIEVGIAAAFSAVRNADQSMMWLGQTKNGDAIAYRTSGYVPQRVSTHAVEREWKTYPRISDAIGFSYQQEGHTFYVLCFPSGDATWAYDLTSGFWHERSALGVDGLFHRHWANCHFFFNKLNVIGDYRNGNLYGFNLNTYTDNNTKRKWLRSWRAFPPGQEKMQPYRFNSLQIDCQTGIDVPDGTNPQLMLRFSNDGGRTWSSERFAQFGKPGETTRRAIFRRLGSTRRNGGLDRVWELGCSDAVPAALIGADLDAEPT
jgi:hypothetical protein